MTGPMLVSIVCQHDLIIGYCGLGEDDTAFCPSPNLLIP